MNLKTAIVAAAVALAPVAAHADTAALQKAKAAKEAAKQTAVDEAKKTAKIEAERKAKENAERLQMEQQKIALQRKAAEETAHQKNLGVIERLDQIAAHTKDAALQAKVATLKQKEQERHSLAIAG